MGEPSQLTSSGVISFVSGRRDCVEKTVVWKIENVSEFLELSNKELEENEVIFEAGSCTLEDGTRTEATWTYMFEHLKKDKNKKNCQDWICGSLHFQPYDDVKSAKACFSVSLFTTGDNCNRTRIASYEMTECEEFAEPGFGGCGWGVDKLITKSRLLQKTRESSNTLEVLLQVKVFSDQGFKPLLQEGHSNPLEASEMLREVNSDLGRLLESGDGADIEVKVPKEVGGEVDEGSYAKKVHKGILMTRSTVFSKMFAQESEMVEAKTGKVVIKDLSPQGLGVFLHYIYTGEVLADWTKVLPELLNAAEKYDCGKLKQFLGHHFLAAVTAANAIKMLKLAKLHSLSFAAKGVSEFIHKNSKAIFTDPLIDKILDNVET